MRDTPWNPLATSLDLLAPGGPKPTERTMQLLRRYDLEKELDGALKSQGLAVGTIAERIAQLNTRPRLQYSNDDAGRAACIADYQRYIDEIVRGLGADFESPPQLNITTVRTRFFRGRCLHNAELPAAAALFRTKRAEIEALLSAETRLDAPTRHALLQTVH